jgi:PAS domain S-box-containing protein
MTDEELEQRVQQLEKEVRDRKGAEDALKDYVAYQSILAVVRGIRADQTEETLLQTLLSEIVEKYDFCMSWYGQYTNGEIRPILSAGRVDRYLDNLVLEIKEPTSPDAQCAMSHAILNGKPFGYADLETDEGFRRWRDYALQLGYGSNLALPLKVNGQVEGGVMVYAEVPQAFPDKRIERLQLLTSEIGIMLGEWRLKRKMQQALQESNERFRAVFDTAEDSIFMKDRSLKYVQVNPAMEKLLAVPADKLIGMTDEDLFGKETGQHIGQVDKRVLSGEVVEEERTKSVGGVAKTFHVIKVPMHDSAGKITGLSGIARDITDRKQAEQFLKESEEKFKTLAEESPNMIFINRNGRVVYANKKCGKITGYKRKDFYSPNFDFLTLIAPEYHETVRANFGRHLRGEEVEPYEFALIAKNGRRVEVLLSTKLMDYEGKKAILGILIDITERKHAEESLQKAYSSLELQVRERTAELVKTNEQLKREIEERKHVEEALRESEEQYRNVVERANDGIVIVQDGLLKYVNPQLAETVGYAIEELTDSLFLNYIDAGERARVSEYHRRRMAGEKAPARYEAALRDKNGRKIDVELNAGTVEYENKRATLAIVRDITERHEKEQRLREKDRELRMKANNLEELNTALRVLLKRREEDKSELEEKVLSNVKELVLPYVARLNKTPLNNHQKSCVEILESNLTDIVSPFSRKLSSKYLGLTPTEIRVADLVKDGKTTKEIAEFMNISGKTVETHRNCIRKKMGIKNKKTNLRAYLSSLQ